MSNTLREDIPNFKAGDVLSIYVNVREGQKVRQQLYKGTVIARKGSGIAETIPVRKISGYWNRQVNVAVPPPLHP